MFDAVLLTALKEVPRQVAEALPVIWAFARANPLFTALVVSAFLLGGGGSGRPRRASSRTR